MRPANRTVTCLTQNPRTCLTVASLNASRRAVDAAEYDCASGCQLHGSGVCGSNTVTYANECLALCSGYAVVSNGPCPAPGTRSASSTVGAKAAMDPMAAATAMRQHPTGQFLQLTTDDAAANAASATAAQARDAAAAAPLVASMQDIRRFESENLVLVGAARLSKFQPSKSGADGCVAAVLFLI